ncbi:hypothetical protein ACFQX6_66925 [Streptosporangium lutulentum]
MGAELVAAYTERGDLVRGRQLCAELLMTAEGAAPPALGQVYRAAALLAAEDGRGDEAIAYIERALALQFDSEEPGQLWRLRSAYVQVLLTVSPGQIKTRRETLIAWEVELPESSVPVDAMQYALALVRVEMLLGCLERAVERIEAILKSEGLPESLHIEAYLLAGLTMAELGRGQDALREVAAATERLHEASASRLTAQRWLTIAHILEQVGEVARSVGAYQRALASAGV